MKLVHSWVRLGLVWFIIDFFGINLWFFVTFFFQSEVVLCTYLLLQGAFVGQCSNSNGLGLLIEN